MDATKVWRQVRDQVQNHERVLLFIFSSENKRVHRHQSRWRSKLLSLTEEHKILSSILELPPLVTFNSHVTHVRVCGACMKKTIIIKSKNSCNPLHQLSISQHLTWLIRRRNIFQPMLIALSFSHAMHAHTASCTTKIISSHNQHSQSVKFNTGLRIYLI